MSNRLQGNHSKGTSLSEFKRRDHRERIIWGDKEGRSSLGSSSQECGINHGTGWGGKSTEGTDGWDMGSKLKFTLGFSWDDNQTYKRTEQGVSFHSRGGGGRITLGYGGKNNQISEELFEEYLTNRGEILQSHGLNAKWGRSGETRTSRQ